MTREQKREIFKNIISGLETKFIQLDKKQSDTQESENDRLAEKYRKLPLE